MGLDEKRDIRSGLIRGRFLGWNTRRVYRIRHRYGVMTAFDVPTSNKPSSKCMVTANWTIRVLNKPLAPIMRGLCHAL